MDQAIAEFRGVVWLLLSVLVSCSSQLPAPVIERVEPDRMASGRVVDLDILGSNFYRDVTVWMDQDRVDLRDRFTVRLSRGTEHVDVATVGWMGATRLTISLGPGMTVGHWDLVVVAPSGLSARLKQALEVYQEVTCDDDADGDGLVSTACGGPDCDDNPAQCGAACGNKTSVDACDGYDNDCDGAVDEDPEHWWFRDRDGDGFGDAAQTVASCVAPPGHVATNEDCDDDPAQCGAACGDIEAADVCDGYDNDCDGAVDEDPEHWWFRDWDGDGFGNPTEAIASCAAVSGYVASSADCDDDPMRCGADCVPGNLEPDTCDSVDQDCDGLVDEDVATTWYADRDGDGHGDPSSAQSACTQPLGYVGNASDCDDDPEVCGATCTPSSTAADVCDGWDSDCDGLVDEDPNITWYRDLDGDLWGDSAFTVLSCKAPTGYVAVGGDCDDDPVGCGSACKPETAAPDICDGLDTDCDGLTDEDSAAPATWFFDGDGDGFGTPDNSHVGCTAPPGYVLAGGDCEDNPDAGCGVNCFPGNTTADNCDGWDQDCNGITDDAAETLWWRDADLDGYPNPSITFLGCDPGPGWVQADLQSGSSNYDCDDADPSVVPGQPCSDGHACTVDDVCDSGLCQGTPIWCGVGVGHWSVEDGVPAAATWQMGSFGAEGPTAAVGDWTVVQGAASATRDEVLFGGLVGKSTRAMLYDDTGWTPLNDLGEQDHDDRLTVAVDYESLSGDGVVFGFGDDSVHGAQWDGSAWSAFQTPLSLGGHAHHVAAASNPTTDEILLAVTTNNHENIVLLWDGTTIQEPALFASTASGEGGCAVAFEGLSGEGLVAFEMEDSAAVGFRVRHNGIFGETSTLAPPPGVFQSVEWLRAASDPSSDRIALGVLTQKKGTAATWFAVWDGAGWLATTAGSTSLSDASDAPSVAVAFEGQSGALLAAWADDTQIHSKRWLPEGGWVELVPFQVGSERVTSLSLSRSRTWNTLMLGILDHDAAVYFAPYNNSWGPPTEATLDSGESQAKPFAFVWLD